LKGADGGGGGRKGADGCRLRGEKGEEFFVRVLKARQAEKFECMADSYVDSDHRERKSFSSKGQDGRKEDVRLVNKIGEVGVRISRGERNLGKKKWLKTWSWVTRLGRGHYGI